MRRVVRRRWQRLGLEAQRVLLTVCQAILGALASAPVAALLDLEVWKAAVLTGAGAFATSLFGLASSWLRVWRRHIADEERRLRNRSPTG